MDELANAITHGLGLVLALVGVPILIALAVARGTAWHVVGISIYGATLILLYAASTIYHSFSIRTPETRLLRIIDHSAIYLLIAGTYTPFTLVNLRGPWGWTLLGLVWTMAVVGIAWKLFHVHRFPVISTLIYVAMGWLALIALKPLEHAVPPAGLAWIFAGGIAYTGGIVFFGWQRYRFNHAVWHLFVLAGSICHYIAVARYVLPKPGLGG